jgi:hypothetical protein
VVERNKKRKEFLRIREEEEKIKRKGILFFLQNISRDILQNIPENILRYFTKYPKKIFWIKFLSFNDLSYVF